MKVLEYTVSTVHLLLYMLKKICQSTKEDSYDCGQLVYSYLYEPTIQAVQ